jgi:hypothetical protein
MAVIGVAYRYYTNGVPSGSTTTAPTAAQSFLCNQIIAQLTAADADTTCTITHNWALTQAQQINLLPNISTWIDVSSLGTVNPVIAWSIATNTITIVKASVVGSNVTLNVVISRPIGLFL